MTCAVVIPVEAVHAVQFLAEVLVAGYVAARALGEEGSVGIVVIDLLDVEGVILQLHQHAVAAEVVLEVDVIDGDVILEGHVASIHQRQLEDIVLIDAGAYVVGGLELFGLPCFGGHEG